MICSTREVNILGRTRKEYFGNIMDRIRKEGLRGNNLWIFLWIFVNLWVFVDFFVDIVNILGKTRKEGGVATCEATICAGLRKYW